MHKRNIYNLNVAGFESAPHGNRPSTVITNPYFLYHATSKMLSEYFITILYFKNSLLLIYNNYSIIYRRQIKLKDHNNFITPSQGSESS